MALHQFVWHRGGRSPASQRRVPFKLPTLDATVLKREPINFRCEPVGSGSLILLARPEGLSGGGRRLRTVSSEAALLSGLVAKGCSAAPPSPPSPPPLSATAEIS